MEQGDAVFLGPCRQRRVGQNHQFGNEQVGFGRGRIFIQRNGDVFAVPFKADHDVRALDDDGALFDAAFLMGPRKFEGLPELPQIGGRRGLPAVQRGFAILIA